MKPARFRGELDAGGTLYGTTRYGRARRPRHGQGNGTLFALTPVAGTYQETILLAFSNPADGQQPESGVVLDSAGSMYGVATYAGYSGYGVVYRVTK